MQPLFVSALRALRSLFAPGMPGLFVLTIGVTIAALMGFVTLTTAFFTWLAAHAQGYGYLPWIGAIGSSVMAWFLFPGIMPVIVNFFYNRIASIIERQDYPATVSHAPSFWPELLHDMRFSALTIVLNVLVLPLYLVPFVNLILFYLLNGYLLGREFFIMSARRHMPLDAAEILRKRHARTVMAAGIVFTMLATIPFVNLVAPFWGIAVMVHLSHRLSEDQYRL